MNHGSYFTPNLSGKLPGDGTTGHVDQLLWQNRGWRQIVSRSDDSRDHGCDRREIGRLRFAPIESLRQRRSSGEHHVMTLRMLVVRMCQGSHQSPFVAASSQQWQMFANRNALSPGRDRRELTSNIRRRIGLHFEAVLLGDAYSPR